MQNFLTVNGQKIYNDILETLKSQSLEVSIDTYELSILAQAFDVQALTCERINDIGFEKMEKGFSQSNIYLMNKQSLDTIIKLGDKYGLNPVSREKIFGKSAKKKDSPSRRLIGSLGDVKTG